VDKHLKTKNRIDLLSKECGANCKIDSSLYESFDVQKGLRDKNGIGVLAGLTKISSIEAHQIVDGEKIPCDGKLLYRGYNIFDLVKGYVKDNRYGFEETAYLLLFGDLPDDKELNEFKQDLSMSRTLPTNFVRDVIMKAPSKDVMNSLAKSVLTLSSYDERSTDLSINTVLSQCIMLISVFPMLAVYSYHAFNHYERDKSMYIHRPDEKLSTAENILRMLRPDMNYTQIESKVLDLALVLHMEHGGGNNSTFTTHVVSSSGTDTYAAIAAALCSLKGPKHGGANIKVVEMMEDLKRNIPDYSDEEKVGAYLGSLLDKKAFDQKGLIYGIGHAVYSVSDPRATLFKGFVEQLSVEKGREDEFELYSMIERLAPKIIADKRNIYKGVSVNVDFYSGFVYSMLDIPKELFTPIFAIARVIGWSAHRIEELINVDKIIRPAYKSIMEEKDYMPISIREVIE